MPVKLRTPVVLAPRELQRVPLLDDPPLGPFQSLVLKLLVELGPRASAYNVIERLSVETGVQIDPAGVYTCVRRLLQKKPDPFIELARTKEAAKGGGKTKIYSVTSAGHDALRSTAAHYRAVAERLDDTVAEEALASTAPPHMQGGADRMGLPSGEAWSGDHVDPSTFGQRRLLDDRHREIQWEPPLVTFYGLRGGPRYGSRGLFSVKH